ncbi:MAG TPA: SAM-dependent methyltransferase, partial [Methanobacteriaceae archaeon]|nr:SAM-dependent methyltransferase [Methanobacteriaceae archaeon]
MSSGKLIGVGVGPGNPDLLTLKAANILKEVPVICSPRSAES